MTHAAASPTRVGRLRLDALSATGRLLPPTMRLLADACALTAAAVAAGHRPASVLLAVLLGLVAVQPSTLQRRRLDPGPGDGLVRATGRLAGVALFGVAVAGADPRRAAVAVTLAVVILPAARWASRRALTALRRRGIGLEPAVIVGAGPVGDALDRVLSQRREFGVLPVGHLDRPGVPGGSGRVLGTPDELPDVLATFGIRRVLVAFSGDREHELVPLMRACADRVPDLRLHVVPRFFELGTAVQETADDVWGFPLVPVRPPGPSPVARWAKRTFDVLGAAAFLAVLAVPMGVIALVVRRSSPGPVLFRQERVGQHGRVFELLKFRTMRPLEDEAAAWRADPMRVTRVGAFLRPTHLDELPQLFNVLRGDMSLVGPRPERPEYVKQFADEHHGYDARHRMPVGLTGWAQVNGFWGDTSIATRARLDNRYIENWSGWKDLQILARTVPTLLGSRAEVEVEDEDEAEDRGSGARTPADGAAA